MANYPGKLLELLGIKHDTSGYFLHIRVSSESTFELLWSIDEYTAKNLRLIAKFNEKYKYRLSFSSSWDTATKRHRARLSQTYLEQSGNISFLCSNDYIQHLLLIKQSKNGIGLDPNYFEPVNLPATLEHEDRPMKQIKFNFVSIISISIIFLLLFSYLNPVFLNKHVFNKDLLAHPVLSIETPLIDDINTSLGHRESIIYSVPKGQVALTFEGGPTRHSKDIMNVLNKYKVGGTFFFTGSNVEKYPHHVKDIYSSGYSIGNHGMNHFNLPDLSYEKQEKELLASNKLIEGTINDTVILFRPPYGAFNEHTESLVNKHQYKMILWNNDPEDWKTHDSKQILSHIRNTNTSGSIIILHETQAVLDVLPRIIEYLQKLGLEIISM